MYLLSDPPKQNILDPIATAVAERRFVGPCIATAKGLMTPALVSIVYESLYGNPSGRSSLCYPPKM
jgi:hypothetical protein